MASETTRPENTQGTVTSAQVELSGLGGLQECLVVVNTFADPNDPRNRATPRGSVGRYKVIFVLSRPGFGLLPESKFSFAGGLEGDSHLAIAKPAISGPGVDEIASVKIESLTASGRLVFNGLPNKEGFLGKIETEIEDSSFWEAEQRCYRELAPILSHWSTQLDIPLSIHQVDSIELRTGNSRTNVTKPFSVAPLAFSGTGQTTPEFRAYASLYREALNSNSLVYQFLCLFKIIEAIGARRARLGAEARARGEPFSRPIELIPDSRAEFVPWLKRIFVVRPKWESFDLDVIFPRESRGRKARYVVERFLGPLRVDVAHTLFSETGEATLSSDDMFHAERVHKWLPLTRCLVRRMLKNEFPDEFLSRLGEDGEIKR